MEPMPEAAAFLPEPPLPDDAGAQEDKALGRRKPNMTDTERLSMADFLLKHSQGEARLPRAVITAAADKYQVHRNTVSRVWNLMKAALDAGASTDVVMKQVLSKKRGNCGRKKKDYSAALERVKQLPLNQRGSLRALSSAVGVPRTTLFRLLRSEDTASSSADTAQQETSEVKPTVANVIKPALSDRNKRDRLRFCLSKMQPTGVFDNMFNVVHINTKWCWLPSSRDAKKTKVMFLVAVARPQWDDERQHQFDGKLGVWPFVVADPPLPLGSYVEDVLAWDQATSQVGRVFRVLETITKKEIQSMITDYVIPAIKMKMPRSLRRGQIFIQLDSQQVRLTPDDPVVAEHGSVDGWNIRVQYQPAYSPELVVLNHSFLKCIYPEPVPPHLRSVAVQLPPVEELVASVERAFAALPKRRISDGFLALQKTMECVMMAGGSNNFESQEDATKRSLQQDGSLPMSVVCRPEALSACQALLSIPQGE
ncbi:Small conductance calcium-activated potassium channel protein [Phytophthora cinnamomi]|uniref:Small conductance calcium-activated potassium channel protein n=1 Tax=Phytophthora cinnamomi TaxID=4785 RepID=UPI003559B6A8|nr:Small conductance calcium-activated potassium channel protein [Phytophthora cinnamomi]